MNLFLGGSRDAPVYPDFQLVLRQHLLPHDHRQPGAWLEVALRDVVGLQDGRPAHLLHLAHADQHEQAEVHQSQVDEENAICTFFRDKNLVVKKIKVDDT